MAKYLIIKVRVAEETTANMADNIVKDVGLINGVCFYAEDAVELMTKLRADPWKE